MVIQIHTLYAPKQTAYEVLQRLQAKPTDSQGDLVRCHTELSHNNTVIRPFIKLIHIVDGECVCGCANMSARVL